MSYDVTRGTTLVVGMVHDGFWGVWGVNRGSGGFLGGPAWVCFTPVWYFLPLWKSCTAPDLVPNTTYWSNWPMFTRLALLAHFWPIGALLGLPNSHFMSKTSPFRDPNCPNCPNCDAGRLVNALNYGKRRLRQELCPLPVNKRKRRRKVRERKHSSSTTLKGLLL